MALPLLDGINIYDLTVAPATEVGATTLYSKGAELYINRAAGDHKLLTELDVDGTTNYISKFTANHKLGNSTLVEDASGNISTIKNITAANLTITNWNTAYTHSQSPHAYLPLAGGTMDNTDLVANLNANLLQGFTYDSFIRNADYNSLNAVGGPFNTYGFTHIDTPTEGFGNYISFGHLTGDSKGQIFAPYDQEKLFFRTIYDSAYTSWKELWHSGNFNPANYATTHDHPYVLKAGDTMTGRLNTNQLTYGRASSVSGTDLNDLITAGFYDGSNLTNAPSIGWYYITVETHQDAPSWVHQTATSFGSGNTENKIFSRTRVGGTWSNWVEVYTTGNLNINNLINTSNISGTINYIPKFTSANSIGDSSLSQDTTGHISTPYNISGRRIISTVADGTAPLVVTSSTKVDRLNVQYLNGYESTQFMANLIDDATDANNLIRSGTYRIGQNANIPGNALYGNLLVITGADTIGQLLMGYDSNDKIYWRSGTTNGTVGTFRAWKELWHDKNFDPDKVVQGINTSCSRATATIYNKYESAQYKSGFWDAYQADWTPNNVDYFWGLTMAHASNSATYNYSGQITIPLSGSDLYFRSVTDTISHSWRKVWHDGNLNINNLISNSNITGTSGYIPKFTGEHTIGNSNIFQDEAGNISTPGNISTALFATGFGNEIWGKVNSLFINYRDNNGVTTGNGVYTNLCDGKGRTVLQIKPDRSATLSGPLTIDNSVAGDGSWNQAGIIIKNNNATAGEVAVSFQNISTGSNYWIQGLNQNADFKLAYGTNFADATTKLSIDTNGQLWQGVLANKYWHAGNDGAGSTLDSDLLDGKQGQIYTDIVEYNVATGAAGWVRIAKMQNVIGSPMYGTISIVTNYWNNFPCPITFNFATTYRNVGYINQLGGSNLHITKARIVYPTTANTEFYIEVYTTTTLTNTWYIRLDNHKNTELFTSYTVGSIPSDYGTKETTFNNSSLTSEYLVANQQLKSNIATGTAPLVISSTTLVDNLNADLLDGYHANSFSLAHEHPYVSNVFLSNSTIDNYHTVPSHGVMINHVITNSPNAPSGYDHLLLTLSYSSIWSYQLAGDCRTGNLYLRNKNNNTWANWLTVWHSGNFDPNALMVNAIDNTSDLNNITRSGTYRISADNANRPAGVEYGNMLVLHGSDTIAQLIMGYDSQNKIYWRAGNPTNIGGNGTMGAWKQIWHSGNFDPTTKENTITASDATKYYRGDKTWATFPTVAANDGILTLSASNGISATQINFSANQVSNASFAISHATGAGYNHIPAGGSTDQYLKYSAAGTAVWAALPVIPTVSGTSGYIPKFTGANSIGNSTLSVDATGNLTNTAKITGTQLVSTVAVGTPPLVVTSDTMVDYLNASFLRGKHPGNFLQIVTQGELADVDVISQTDYNALVTAGTVVTNRLYIII